MKVIDLLNKIANEEEVPKKIKYYDMIFEYDETDDNEILRYYDVERQEYLTDICHLETEIEIIEDKPKKIEKIGNDYYHKEQDEINEIFQRKLNEIIDYINNMEE